MSKDGNDTRGPDISDSTAQRRPTSAVEKLLAEWEDFAPLSEASEVERLLTSMERDLNDDSALGYGVPLRWGAKSVIQQLRAAIEADREGLEGYEERWAVNTGGQEYAHYRNEEDAQHDAELIYGDRSEAFRILVPASPEPDKETP